MKAYVDEAFGRFLHTLGMFRGAKSECLELGSNPYLLTALLEEFTDLDLTLANYFGPGFGDSLTQQVTYTDIRTGERKTRDYTSCLFNIEEEPFPFGDDSFD
jgi:hypothetical protein